MRPLLTGFAFTICTWLLADAQEPKAEPKPANKVPAKADKAPAKADKPAKDEPVQGRKTKKIEGFTFLISDEALTADYSKYERSPLEVLEYECKLLTKMLSPKAVELLRRLTIFVDWDNKVSLSNGRSGTALASYYGGNAQQMAKEGRHPLQAKTVTIHTLKALTDQRQPKYDARTSCLLLHEFAHAIHDQLLSYDHSGILLAYEQAMERRLYEKDSYAATNHREFFAELSCAYLDRLWYYPHNRADLKKHDPVTCKTMETVWKGSSATNTSKVIMAHSQKVSLDVMFPKDIKLGKAIAGPEVVPAKLAGKAVVIGYWGAEFTNVLNRLERLQGELGDYGLVVIGAHAFVQPDEKVKKLAAERGPRIPVFQGVFVREEAGKAMKGQPGGHALVFDHTGKCLYRGSAYDVDEAARAAVGKLLLSSAVGSEEVPKTFKSVADAFAAGASPVTVVSKLGPLVNSQDADTKSAAKKLADLILAPGEKAFAGAQANVKSDPVAAFIASERVANQYKNTPLATKATALVSKLKSDKAVATELKARTLANQVEQLGNKLRGQAGSYNPSDTDFQKKNRQTLDQLQAILGQLRKQYPSTYATAEAEKVGREFAIP